MAGREPQTQAAEKSREQELTGTDNVRRGHASSPPALHIRSAAQAVIFPNLEETPVALSWHAQPGGHVFTAYTWMQKPA